MSRQSDLINEVKRIFENETSNDSDQGGECGLDEMARKPFNNTLTEKGKEEITKAVKAMIAEEKEGKAKHSDNYVFKTLAKLAKCKVGEPVTTTELQQVAGVKHPQPMNALLSKLVASGYLERATSHVEPEKGEPKPKGRPKGPEKEKVEKPAKFGGLPLAKKVSPSAIDKDNDGKSDDVVTENLEENESSIQDEFKKKMESLINNSEIEYVAEFALEDIEMGIGDNALKYLKDYFKSDWKKIADFLMNHQINEPGELSFITPQEYKAALKGFNKADNYEDQFGGNPLKENEELSEISLASLEKSLINKYGAKGDKLAEDESLDEAELGGAETNPTEDTRDNQSAIHPINESFALMQFRAGIITDTQYRKAIGLDKIK